VPNPRCQATTGPIDNGHRIAEEAPVALADAVRPSCVSVTIVELAGGEWTACEVAVESST
jgi:hypothetical protein